MIDITLKPLLPSLRERKRYLVYEIISEKPVAHSKPVQEQITTAAQHLFGLYGLSHLRLRFLPEKFRQKTQRGILRFHHAATAWVKTALLFVSHIDKQPVIVRSISVSGTLRKASLCLRGG